MKIRFIGTGSGKTSLVRYHSSILVSSDNYNLLIDAGDGISRALLSQKIDYNSIDGIIFTHLHPDHFAGLSSLIVQMKMNGRNNPLEIIIHKSLKEFLEKFLLYSNLPQEQMNFEINHKTFVEDDRISISNDFVVVARKNSHLNKLKRYSSKYSQISFLCFGLLFSIDNKNLIYTSDIGSHEDLFLFEKNPVDIFITETTHLEPSILFDKLKKIKTENIFLTHISDDDFSKLNAILATQPEELKSRIQFAKDELFFEI